MSQESEDRDLEAFITAIQEEWLLSDGQLMEETISWIEANHPDLIAEWKARYRPPTRQEIVQKMNFRADFGDEDFRRGMNAGVRGLLGEAITLPRDTDYALYFEAGPDLINFTRVRAPDLPQGPEIQKWWGTQSGRAVAIRWLVEVDRKLADRLFPDVEEVNIVWSI